MNIPHPSTNGPTFDELERATDAAHDAVERLYALAEAIPTLDGPVGSYDVETIRAAQYASEAAHRAHDAAHDALNRLHVARLAHAAADLDARVRAFDAAHDAVADAGGDRG